MTPRVTRVPRWRIAAAWAVLAVLALFALVFAPIYYRNLELQRFVVGITRSVENQTKSAEALRGIVASKAQSLNLPVKEDNVQVSRSDNTLRIGVKYFVRVTLPGYTVDLHFHPTASNK